jgi:hypothetical protein
MKNDPEFIRALIKGNNIIWSLMYYDELIIKANYQLSYLEKADLPFYNTAQALSAIDAKSLVEIEDYYRQYEIAPAFYLDPGSLAWLKPYLIEHHYVESEEELENWWGLALDDKVMAINCQDYLKIPKEQVQLKIINPKHLDDLNQFLEINQTASQLPQYIVDKLRINMQHRQYQGATNTLYIAYVNGIAASVRTLGLYNNMAYLAEAGTLPAYQKQGLHTFTTSFLMQEAYKQGASFVALTCARDSVTNFTSKRAGLELLFQRQFMRK